jgi:hypothetical protein
MRRIIVDCDGILRQFIRALQEKYSQVYPNHWIKTPITRWELHPFFQLGQGIYDFAFHDYAEDVFYKLAEPYDGAISAFNFIVENSKSSDYFMLVTAQNITCEQWTKKWLFDYQVIPDETIYVRDIKDKLALDYDIILEDCPYTLEESFNLGKLTVCMDRPWNKQINPAIPRISHISEFDKYLF